MAIKMKRSAVAGKVPTTTDLDLGELAVNTSDGKLYMKKDNGTASIVEVGGVVSVAGKTGAVMLAKGDVGLGSVDNTSDASKPISTATQSALNTKAPLASPTFTGTPAAPTAAFGTSTTQIATTAYVREAVNAARPRRGAADLLAGEEGIAFDFRTRTAVINDYDDVLSDSGRPSDLGALTRSSVATYIDKDGLLKSASSNVLRYTYDAATRERRGALLEGASTNLLTYSEQFDNAAWTQTRSSITANAAVAPDGATTADALIEDSTASNTHALTGASGTIAKDVLQTGSIWVKANGRTKLEIQLNAFAGNNVSGRFDLTAVSATASAGGSGGSASASIVAYPNGWYRCSVTGIPKVGATGETSIQMTLLMLDAAGESSYNGDNTSGLYLWGGQLELGGAASSYVATTSSTATRSADIYTVGPSTFPVQASGECTLYLRGRLKQLRIDSNAAVLFSAIYSGTPTTEFIQLREGSIISGADVVVRTNNVVLADTYSTSVPIDTEIAFAASVKQNDLKFYENMMQVAIDTDLNVPTINQLRIVPGIGSIYEIDEIAYIARALPAAELAALTTV